MTQLSTDWPNCLLSSSTIYWVTQLSTDWPDYLYWVARARLSTEWPDYLLNDSTSIFYCVTTLPRLSTDTTQLSTARNDYLLTDPTIYNWVVRPRLLTEWLDYPLHDLSSTFYYVAPLYLDYLLRDSVIYGLTRLSTDWPDYLLSDSTSKIPHTQNFHDPCQFSC